MTQQLSLVATPDTTLPAGRPVQAQRPRSGPIPLQSRTDIWARVDARVVRTATCWWWTGAAAGGNGYGAFARTHHQIVGAHRYALKMALGHRLDDLEVAVHGCNGRCASGRARSRRRRQPHPEHRHMVL